jgi:surface antigen
MALLLRHTRLSAFAVSLMLLLPSSIAGAEVQIAQLGLPWSGLSRDDLGRMHAAAARLYEGRSIGTVERWRNPDSNDAGTVTLLRQFETKGMPCSQIEYKFLVAETGELRHYTLDWCKISSGEWKIVDLGSHN